MTAILEASVPAPAAPRFVSWETDDEWCSRWVASAPMGEGVLTPFGVPDPESLSPEAAVNMLVGLERTSNWLEAQKVRLLARLSRRPGTLPMHAGGGTPREVSEREVIARGFLREEIACAVHRSPQQVQALMDTAVVLVERLPATVAVMDAGDLPYGHAQALVDAVRPLDDEVTAKVEERVLRRGSLQTRALFRGSLRRAVATLDPRGVQERHERAAEDRQVGFWPEDNAMATITAFLPCDGAVTVRTAVQSVADRLARSNPQGRTADQLRADALVEICAGVLTGGVLNGGGVTGGVVGELPTQQGHRPTIQVSVALSTLLHLDEQPGQLTGYGDVPADVARRMAADPTGTWIRLVTDDLGRLIDYGRTKYRPPAALRDHVIARDRTERFPGSTRGARKSEIDHIQARVDDGETNERNLQLLSKRSQTLKHEAGWQVETLPDGTTHWTTPQGRHHYQPPDPYPIDTTFRSDGGAG